MRPKEVTTAVRILYATLLIGVIRSAVDLYLVRSLNELTAVPLAEQDVLFLVSTALTLLISGGLFFLIWRGKNWARIVYLVLFLLGLLFGIMPLLQSLRSVPISGALGVLLVVLQIVALALLFGEGASPWFRKPASDSPAQTPASKSAPQSPPPPPV